MKDILLYYKGRFQRIFIYTGKKWYYIIAKTLCVAVGLPLYVALLPLDIVNFLIYALFSFIPYLNTFFLFICRTVSIICGAGHYIAILPDAKMYMERHKQELKEEFLKSQRQELEEGGREVPLEIIGEGQAQYEGETQVEEGAAEQPADGESSASLEQEE